MRAKPHTSYEPLTVDPSASIFVLTGAGISAESGIKTFRDAGGMWEEHRFEDVASPEGWARDAGLVWRFLLATARASARVQTERGALCARSARARHRGSLVRLHAERRSAPRSGRLDERVSHARRALEDALREMRFRAPFRDESSYLDRMPKCDACGGRLRPHIAGSARSRSISTGCAKKLDACSVFISRGKLRRRLSRSGVRACRTPTRRPAYTIYVGPRNRRERHRPSTNFGSAKQETSCPRCSHRDEEKDADRRARDRRALRGLVRARMRFVSNAPLSGSRGRVRGPGRSSDDRHDERRREAHAYDYAESTDAAVVVFFHGNGETAENGLDLAQTLRTHGIGTVLAEYRVIRIESRRGRSRARKDSTPTRLRSSTRSTKKGSARRRSCSSDIRSGAASRRRWAARGRGRSLVLIAPFTSIPAVAGRHAPFLPTSLLVGDKFDTLSKAPKIDLPTTIGPRHRRRVVPFDMGERLSKSFPHATFVPITGGGNADLFAVANDRLIRRDRVARGSLA